MAALAVFISMQAPESVGVSSMQSSFLGVS